MFPKFIKHAISIQIAILFKLFILSCTFIAHTVLRIFVFSSDLINRKSSRQTNRIVNHELWIRSGEHFWFLNNHKEIKILKFVYNKVHYNKWAILFKCKLASVLDKNST